MVFAKHGFPLEEIKDYFRKRGSSIELQKYHLNETRLRFILLNLIYVDQMGSSPFDVKFKGNDPHVDHIYPHSMLRSKLDLLSADINHLGNSDLLARRTTFVSARSYRLAISLD